MKLFVKRNAERDGERGQMLVMFTLFLTVLILFVGLGIDVGFAYVTKAELSKAVDAAALAGMDSLSDGTITASSIAKATFAANYGRPGRDTGTVTANPVFTTDANNNITLTVDATATTRTFFVRILPTWKTMTVKSSAQTTKSKLIMTLVLDRSGSMNDEDSSGFSGADKMTESVTNFINHFDDARDRVALATFASNNRVDVQISPTIGTAFKQRIINATKAVYLGNPPPGVAGGTFSQGGLTNALQQNNIPIVAPGEFANRVTVFFTDGQANIVQDKFPCQTDPWNFGGRDSGNTVGFFDYNDTTMNGQNEKCNTTGGTPSCCPGTSKFRSTYAGGTLKSFLQPDVSNEAEYRAIQVAKDMRAVGTTVFSIGLGANLNQPFLKEVANDPTGPNYNPNLPTGRAVFAPKADQLAQVFDTIAKEILLRLTQ